MPLTKHYNMKKILFFIILFLSFEVYCQDTFDEQLKNFAENISNKLSKKGKDTLAIWHFTNHKKQKTTLSDYVADDISIHMVNGNHDFFVLDRFFIDQILNEHQLKSDHYIKPETAKELGNFIHADYIITGNAFKIGDYIKIRINVLDTESSQKVVADQIQIPIDESIASFLGIHFDEKIDEKNKVLEPYQGNAPDLEPVKVYRTNNQFGKRRLAGADPNDYYRQVNRTNTSSSKSNRNSTQDGLVLAGTELLKFLNNKKSKEKNKITDYVVANKHSRNDIKVNTAYYSKTTNSVFAYIKTKQDLPNYEIRVSILNKKGIEVANCLVRISQKKREANFYKFKFQHNFELSNKMKILFD